MQCVRQQTDYEHWNNNTKNVNEYFDEFVFHDFVFTNILTILITTKQILTFNNDF